MGRWRKESSTCLTQACFLEGLNLFLNVDNFSSANNLLASLPCDKMMWNWKWNHVARLHDSGKRILKPRLTFLLKSSYPVQGHKTLASVKAIHNSIVDLSQALIYQTNNKNVLDLWNQPPHCSWSEGVGRLRLAFIPNGKDGELKASCKGQFFQRTDRFLQNTSAPQSFPCSFPFGFQ